MIKLFEPSQKQIKNTNIFNYKNFLENDLKKKFSNYQSLWKWSVNNPEIFWKSIANYFKIPLKKNNNFLYLKKK